MTPTAFTTRPFAGVQDLHLMADLVRASSDDYAHVVDLPYRLSSPSLDSTENVRLWVDADGALFAFGVVQQPWQALDYALHPRAHAAGVEDQILVWAIGRAAELGQERGSPYRLNVYVPDDRHEQMNALERHGFVRDNTWTMLYLGQSPIASPLPSLLPTGFVIRPLAGSDEVEAYVALHRAAFGSINMTVPWRRRMLDMPEYIPDLDLVVVTPDGRLAAFCICWLHPDGSTGQIEPLGVHPDFQQLGLGRAVLLEGLGHLRDHGATTALVQAYANNDPARYLYESVGFRSTRTLITYAQEVI